MAKKFYRKEIFFLPFVLEEGDWENLERVAGSQIKDDVRVSIGNAINRYLQNIKIYAESARTSEVKPILVSLQKGCSEMQKALGDLLMVTLTDEAFCKWVRERKGKGYWDGQRIGRDIFAVAANRRATEGLNHLMHAPDRDRMTEKQENDSATCALASSIRKSNEIVYEAAVDLINSKSDSEIDKSKLEELFLIITNFSIAISDSLESLPLDQGVDGDKFFDDFLIELVDAYKSFAVSKKSKIRDDFVFFILQIMNRRKGTVPGARQGYIELFPKTEKFNSSCLDYSHLPDALREARKSRRRKKKCVDKDCVEAEIGRSGVPASGGCDD